MSEQVTNVEEYYVGQRFEGEYPPECAVWCNETGNYIDLIGENLFEVKAPEPLTPEEIEAHTLEESKRQRDEAIKNMIVDVDGLQFQADEQSRARMKDTASVMGTEEKVEWILADDSIVPVTKAQLEKAVELSIRKQNELMIVPYKEASERAVKVIPEVA